MEKNVAKENVSAPKAKAKPQRKKSAFSKFVSLVVIGFSVFMLYGVSKEIISTMELKKQIGVVDAELKKLEAENELLKVQKEKLADPAYVQSFARGNYMLSKEGEQIFYLPPNEK